VDAPERIQDADRSARRERPALVDVLLRRASPRQQREQQRHPLE